VNALAVFYIRARLHVDNVAEPHTQVLTHDLVHADLGFLARVIGKHDTNGVLALLAFDLHRVTAEQRELLHGVEMQRDDTVVIIDGIVYDQTVGVFLL